MQKNNNRILFLLRKNKFFIYIRNLLVVLAVVLIILIFLELFFAKNSIGNRNNLDFYINRDHGLPKNYRHHPFLDFTHDYQVGDNKCKEGDEDAALKIAIYGGSTVYDGHNNNSIAYYLSQILCDLNHDVVVLNYGSASYVSTQELIKFILHKRDGEEIDIAIFYNGFNDLMSDIPGYPSAHMTKEVFNFYNFHHQYLFSNTIDSLWFLFYSRGLIGKSKVEDSSTTNIEYFDYDFTNNHKENRYHDIMRVYFENVKIIKSLENNYNFYSFFYFQPTLVNKKVLSPEEELFWKKNDGHRDLNYVQKYIDFFLKDDEYVVDLRKIFDSYKFTIFNDYCHITAEGNKIIAERISKDIVDYLENN